MIPTGGEVHHKDIFLGLLAGGTAQRMGGRDKYALLLPDGRRFGTALVEAFRSRVTHVVLSLRPEQHLDEPGTSAVHDSFPGRGPLGGLCALLEAAPNDWCFLLACDMPRASPEVLDCLARHVAPGVDAVAPQTPRGVEPTCALYHRRLAPVARESLARDENALHQFLERVGAARVPLDGPLAASLANFNRQEELEVLRRG